MPLLLALPLILAAHLAQGQEYEANLLRIADGVVELRFHAPTGFLCRLEMTTDLARPFEPASGWFAGDGQSIQTPIYYKEQAPRTNALSETLTIYPFTNGLSLVFRSNSDGSTLAGLLDQDYRMLPPIHIQPCTTNQNQLVLLRGSLHWNPGYYTYNFQGLPLDAQLALQPIVNQYAAITNMLTRNDSYGPTNCGPGIILPGANAFFRVSRLAEDQDGDGLSWDAEVFLTGTDPQKPDTDGNGIPDGLEDPDGDSIANVDEIQFGFNPRIDDSGMSNLVQRFSYDGLHRLRTITTAGTVVWQATLDKQGNIQRITP